jgi:hypothetical protein
MLSVLVSWTSRLPEFGAQDAPLDSQNLLEDRRGLRKLAILRIVLCQAIHRFQRSRMLRAQHSTPYFHS